VDDRRAFQGEHFMASSRAGSESRFDLLVVRMVLREHPVDAVNRLRLGVRAI
jgi:hypothetical protein